MAGTGNVMNVGSVVFAEGALISISISITMPSIQIWRVESVPRTNRLVVTSARYGTLVHCLYVGSVQPT